MEATRIIIMLIKILVILSIVGVVISTIMIFMKGINFIALSIANAICRNKTEVEVNYLIPFVIFCVSTIILTCLFVYIVL